MTKPNASHAAPDFAPDLNPDPDADPHPDRWNKPKMAAFLRELASCHSVAAAARSVGMSRQSAYRLRARLKGKPFDLGWETAFQHSYDALHQAALERALHGTEVPVFFNGAQIGTRQHFDERLTCFLLAARNRGGAQQLGRYRAAADYWSERWDTLVDHVATGNARWPHDSTAPGEVGGEAGGYDAAATEAARSEQDSAAVSASDRYTAPDPLPNNRQL
jgi:hypothetical protein